MTGLGRCGTCDRVVWPWQDVFLWGGHWQHAECGWVQIDLGEDLDRLTWPAGDSDGLEPRETSGGA